MITEKITSDPMTEGQLKQIRRIGQDGIDSFNSDILPTLGFSKDESQEILKSGNLVQSDMETAMIEILQKYAIVDKRFQLFADLGVITVPDDYVSQKHLDSFKRENESKFGWGYNSNITDKNFPNPTRILKPGDKLWVRAFKQIVPGETTSEDRMTFLSKMNAVHTGAHGVSLVYQQKRDLLPKGYWYVSFDEKERLWKDADGYRRVPDVCAGSIGDFEFNLGYFELPWRGGLLILCFCDLPVEKTGE